MDDRFAEVFTEPCDGEVTYREITRTTGVRSLLQDCSCGQFLGSHLLQNESEIVYPHCQKVITEEDAIEGMSELRLCHRKGVRYNAYMGFWPEGEDMSDSEYAIVRKRLEA